MGTKYIINAFNYPYSGIEKQIQTEWIILCIVWFIKLSFKFNGVDISKRS